MDNEKLKILMFDMILYSKFIYNPKKLHVTIQTFHKQKNIDQIKTLQKVENQ
jgi:hypothetical protein